MIISRAPAPGYFLIVCMLFLVWNIIGDFSYYSQVTADLAQMAKTDAYGARIFGAMPSWVWACYAVGVWGSTLATLLMLKRRQLAVPVYAIALIAIIAQFAYSFLGTNLIAVKGVVTAMAFPAFIIAMAIVQLMFARAMKARGVLA